MYHVAEICSKDLLERGEHLNQTENNELAMNKRAPCLLSRDDFLPNRGPAHDERFGGGGGGATHIRAACLRMRSTGTPTSETERKRAEEMVGLDAHVAKHVALLPATYLRWGPGVKKRLFGVHRSDDFLFFLTMI